MCWLLYLGASNFTLGRFFWWLNGNVLPGEGPGEDEDDDLRLRVLNTPTMAHLPALLDWSIIGCTILLLALMNL